MQIAIVGAGIVGSAIAYELSMDQRYDITVYDGASGPVQENQSFYSGGTGAALGVLMGAICKKEKGRNLRRRLAGLDWYDRVIPDLEALLGVYIPYNRQGLLMMQYAGDRSEQDLAHWEALALIRPSQNRRLEIWQPEQIQQACPQVNLKGVGLDRIVAAIYSPDDRQVHPTRLTQALIAAAQLRGVRFCWNVEVGIAVGGAPPECDVMVVSAGLGSSEIMRSIAAENPLDLRPVLGQAIQVRMPEPLGHPAFQPVITGHDTHVVPLDQTPENRDYWVGATVEFEPDGQIDIGDPIAKPEAFEAMWEKATALVPELAIAEKVRTWQGMRPRPVGRPAPVIEWATGFDTPKVLLATGHYRNGVLLAPATAIEVREMLGTIG